MYIYYWESLQSVYIYLLPTIYSYKTIQTNSIRFNLTTANCIEKYYTWNQFGHFTKSIQMNFIFEMRTFEVFSWIFDMNSFSFFFAWVFISLCEYISTGVSGNKRHRYRLIKNYTYSIINARFSNGTIRYSSVHKFKCSRTDINIRRHKTGCIACCV